VVDRRAATVFAAHLELALRVAPVVIVEGVETRGDLRFLRGVAAGRGRVHAQGYLFGRPQLLPTR